MKATIADVKAAELGDQDKFIINMNNIQRRCNLRVLKIIIPPKFGGLHFE
jgi:hypothetical protein